MKKTTLLAVLGLSVLLVACGDNKEKATNVPENAPEEKETNNGTVNNGTTNNGTNTANNATDAPYNFTHFELDVDYANNKSFEVDYENESIGTEAKIEDDFKNDILQGNTAMDVLVPIFEKFTFDVNTTDDEIIDEVLKAFNLSTDYIEFELDVRFADGVLKEIRRRQ